MSNTRVDQLNKLCQATVLLSGDTIKDLFFWNDWLFDTGEKAYARLFEPRYGNTYSYVTLRHRRAAWFRDVPMQLFRERIYKT